MTKPKQSELLKPKFWHFRLENYTGDLLPKGGATICVFINLDDEYCIGIATCSVEDAFHKKTGRAKSLGRAKSKQEVIKIPHNKIDNIQSHIKQTGYSSIQKMLDNKFQWTEFKNVICGKEETRFCLDQAPFWGLRN